MSWAGVINYFAGFAVCYFLWARPAEKRADDLEGEMEYIHRSYLARSITWPPMDRMKEKSIECGCAAEPENQLDSVLTTMGFFIYLRWLRTELQRINPNLRTQFSDEKIKEKNNDKNVDSKNSQH